MDHQHEKPKAADGREGHVSPNECPSATGEGQAMQPVKPASSSADPEASRKRRRGAGTGTPAKPRKPTLAERFEAFASKLSTRNNFWHRVCSLIWLPYAFKSGIKMARENREGGEENFSCILPFRRFNKNWYNAMAGASLLANSEIAGGMYIFKRVGEDYTVVCKELNYKFLRPCFGPAVYKVVPNSALDTAIAEGTEFNITLTLNIYQPPSKPSERERRVGRCVTTFHVTPKTHHKQRRAEGRSVAVR